MMRTESGRVWRRDRWTGGTGMKPKKQWDHKWYTKEFLQRLKATAAVEMDGNLPYITKYAPDAGSPNGIDPRLLGGPMGKMARSTGLVPNFILDRVKDPGNAEDLGRIPCRV